MKDRKKSVMLVSVLDLKLKVTFKYSHFFTLKKIILSLSDL